MITKRSQRNFSLLTTKVVAGSPLTMSLLQMAFHFSTPLQIKEHEGNGIKNRLMAKPNG